MNIVLYYLCIHEKEHVLADLFTSKNEVFFLEGVGVRQLII